MFKVFPKIILHGDKVKAQKLWRLGVQEYQKLDNLTRLGKLKQNARLTIFSDGVEVKCKKWFGLGIIEIFVPPTPIQEMPQKGFPEGLYLVIRFSPGLDQGGFFCTDTCFVWDVLRSKIKKIEYKEYHVWADIEDKLLAAKIQEELPLYTDFNFYGWNSGLTGLVPYTEHTRTLIDDCNETAPEYQLWHYEGSYENSIDQQVTRPDGVVELNRKLRGAEYNYDKLGEYALYVPIYNNGVIVTQYPPGWSITNTADFYPSYRKEAHVHYSSSVYGTCTVGAHKNDIICFPLNAELDNQYTKYTRSGTMPCLYGGNVGYDWTKDIYNNRGFVLNSPIGSKRILRGFNEYHYRGPDYLGYIGSYCYTDRSITSISRMELNYNVSGYIPDGKYAGAKYQVLASLLYAKKARTTEKSTIVGYNAYSYAIWENSETVNTNILQFEAKAIAGCDQDKIMPEYIDVTEQKRNDKLEVEIEKFISLLDYRTDWNHNYRLGYLSAFLIDMSKFN
jgi:hypothetical protein